MTQAESEDRQYMQCCLDLAELAGKMDEVPVGALVVFEGKIIAKAYNQTISSCDPSAHAEILALREAARILGNHRLNDCQLYVSLEPCLMCVGAMIQARIHRIIYACCDVRFGVLSPDPSVFKTLNHNHRPSVTGGVLATQAKSLLQNFFNARR